MTETTNPATGVLDSEARPQPKASSPAPTPKKRGDHKKQAAGPAPSGFAAYVAALPDPFRPRHLAEAIQLYAAEHNIIGDVLATIDPHRFGKDHGLPNPVKRFRITGEKKGQQVEPAEFDVVDASEGVRQFILLRGIKEPHQWEIPIIPA